VGQTLKISALSSQKTASAIRNKTASLSVRDHWLEANATWHRHPADVLDSSISKRWYEIFRRKKSRGAVD
jgi:hypothetical protein